MAEEEAQGPTLLAEESSLSVRVRQGGSPRRLVVGLDSSQFAESVLRWTLENVADTGDRVFMVLVQEPPDAYRMDTLYASDEMFYQIQEQMVKEAESRMAVFMEVGGHHKKAGVSLVPVRLVGEPREQLCKYVEDVAADLMVLGSRGLSTLQRLWMGSVSHYCVHHAQCPVLIVKHPVHAGGEAPKSGEHTATGA